MNSSGWHSWNAGSQLRLKSENWFNNQQPIVEDDELLSGNSKLNGKAEEKQKLKLLRNCPPVIIDTCIRKMNLYIYTTYLNLSPYNTVSGMAHYNWRVFLQKLNLTKA